MYGIRWQFGNSNNKWHFQGGFYSVQEALYFWRTNKKTEGSYTYDIMKQNEQGEYRLCLSTENRDI